jgi:hypothetical protein
LLSKTDFGHFDEFIPDFFANVIHDCWRHSLIKLAILQAELGVEVKKITAANKWQLMGKRLTLWK